MFAVMGTMGSGVRGFGPAHPGRGRRQTEETLILDRVVAAVTPRVAAQQPPAGQDQAPEYAEAADRLRGVGRAGGLVLAAAREERRDHALVGDDRRDRDAAGPAAHDGAGGGAACGFSPSDRP